MQIFLQTKDRSKANFLLRFSLKIDNVMSEDDAFYLNQLSVLLIVTRKGIQKETLLVPKCSKLDFFSIC